MNTARELEATLVVVSEDPERVLDEIAGLRVLAGYPLVPGPTQASRDTYLDDTDRTLSRAGFALRVRKRNDLLLVALKGPSQKTGWGALERDELETAWSKTAMVQLADALEALGLRLDTHRRTGFLFDPVEVMTRWGLNVVQLRDLNRRILAVEDPRRGTAVAEVAIDDVAYLPESEEIRHSEVEIEAAGSDKRAAVRLMVSALMSMYGHCLRPWPYGKLATGMALERHLREGNKTHFNQRKRLIPEMYDRIRDRLTAEFSDPGRDVTA